jgi:hypothetical protein
MKLISSVGSDAGTQSAASDHLFADGFGPTSGDIRALLTEAPTNDGFLPDCYQFAQSLAPSETAADFSPVAGFSFGPEAAPQQSQRPICHFRGTGSSSRDVQPASNTVTIANPSPRALYVRKQG